MNKIDYNVSIQPVAPHIRDDYARQLRSEFLRELFVTLFQKVRNKRNNVGLDSRRSLDPVVNH